MSNVTTIQPRIDLPMEVLGVLSRQAEPTLAEIAHDIETHHRQRFTAEEVVEAIGTLRVMGFEIHEHDDPDGVRYELVRPGGAA